MPAKAIVRQHVERIDGVSRTWIEWESESGFMVKRLYVEVDFDTDPNAPGYREGVIDAIFDTTKAVLEDGTMVTSNLSIVPKGVR